MNKKILSGALAAMMLVAPANAAGGVISANRGKGDVPVHLTQETTQFSVTVPTVLPVDVSADGIVTVASDNKIINNSFGPVEVKSVFIESLEDWKLVDFDTDFKAKKVGLHEYGFQMNHGNAFPDGSCVAVFESIPGGSYINFVYDSNVATQHTAIDHKNIANVIFTVGWDSKYLPKPQAHSEFSLENAWKYLRPLTGVIRFSTQAYGGSDGIDISTNQDRSVIAVIDGQNATVYGEGGAICPNCESNTNSGVFDSYKAALLDLRGLDTSKMNCMYDMFCGFYGDVAAEINVSMMDTSNVTDMEYMFHYFKADTMDLTSFDTRNVESMADMFYGAEFNVLDLSSFDMSNVRNVSNMFGASKIKKVICRTQEDLNKMKNSSDCPSDIVFVIK